jgi:mRNA biogenesis factor
MKYNALKKQASAAYPNIISSYANMPLEIDGVNSVSHKNQLSSLRTELARINKKKEEYVAEHPEHSKLVFRARYKKAEQETDRKEGENKKKERKVFDKKGIPRHPERSIYYDPVMNPFGFPPPGMPYLERREYPCDFLALQCLWAVALRPDEVDSQAEDTSDEDEGEPYSRGNILEQLYNRHT